VGVVRPIPHFRIFRRPDGSLEGTVAGSKRDRQVMPEGKYSLIAFRTEGERWMGPLGFIDGVPDASLDLLWASLEASGLVDRLEDEPAQNAGTH